MNINSHFKQQLFYGFVCGPLFKLMKMNTLPPRHRKQYVTVLQSCARNQVIQRWEGRHQAQRKWLTHPYTYDCIKVGSAGSLLGLAPGPFIKWQNMCLSTIVRRLVVNSDSDCASIWSYCWGDWRFATFVAVRQCSDIISATAHSSILVC